MTNPDIEKLCDEVCSQMWKDGWRETFTWEQEVKAAIRILKERGFRAVPDGMVVVPRSIEGNTAMFNAGREALAKNQKGSFGVQISHAWQAILAAAPQKTGGG